MRIAMFTNLYLPKVGGVSISVDRFSRAYRQRGHDVLIVAPDFPDQPRNEPDVERVSAIRNFNDTDFSVALPPGPELSRRLTEFAPDLLHAHHPFLLGDCALRAAAHRGLPLVYTHHTMYEHYTHYVPVDSKAMRNFVVELSKRYAQFCHRVIAPSESVADILRQRGVTSPIDVVPTGVDVEQFASGDRQRGRERLGAGEGEFILGHVGRLAEEKNLAFLTRFVARTLQRAEDCRFAVAGSGDMAQPMRRTLEREGVGDSARFVGMLGGQDLPDFYAAMDAFVFASKSETQGMVLAEALAAGTPVVALDAPGAREVVRDGRNGRLVQQEDEEAFVEALLWLRDRSTDEARTIVENARADAGNFRLEDCVDRALDVYSRALDSGPAAEPFTHSTWETLLRGIQREWELWSSRAASLTNAIEADGDPRNRTP